VDPYLSLLQRVRIDHGWTASLNDLITSSSPETKPALNRRPGLWFGICLGLVVVLVVVALLLRPGDADRTKVAVVPDARPLVSTQLGVFVGAEPEKVHAYDAWLGRDVAYVVDFSDRETWADIAAPQTQIDTWKDEPYRKVYSVALLPADPADTMARGATGEYNQYFTDLAQRLVAGGQDDAILRLGWEFNLEDSRWSTDDPAAFIAYWRQVVTAMRAVPGQHFEIDWNPNNGDTTYDAVNYYPGSDVVDYIGVDAYDVSWASGAYPYPENCDDACRTTRQKVAWDDSVYGGARGLRFWSGFAKQQGKPMSLPEWGFWQRPDGHGGGNDPDYLRRMAAFIDDPANRVAYQSYFEYDGSDGPHRLMTTFASSADLYRSLFVT
jgi:hypothetical protein